jgi:hypothetical protein
MSSWAEHLGEELGERRSGIAYVEALGFIELARSSPARAEDSAHN